MLSLLSHSSTGTQFPICEETKPRIKKTNKLSDRLKHREVDTEMRKQKYKSKVLNSNFYNPQSFEELQCKKTIVFTPSIDFSNDYNNDRDEDIKWADFLPRLVQPDDDDVKMEKQKKLNHLIKEVDEGKKVIANRVHVAVNDEPPTLVSEDKKHTTKDPGFYNFFVDLLETTLSVYDIKSQYNIQNPPSAVSSKVAFEMDEVVANKLHVVPEKKYPSVTSRYNERLPNKEKVIDYFQLGAPLKIKRTKKQTKNKKHKLDFAFTKYGTLKSDPKKQMLAYQSTSNAQKKTFQNKNSKQILINLLKEQLSMSNKFEEPENLFQALRVLAKNKVKTHKTTRFEKAEDVYSEHKLKRRKSILPNY